MPPSSAPPEYAGLAMIVISFSLPSLLMGLRSRWEIGAIVALLALWLAFQTGREKVRKYRTRNWPTAPGKIADIRARKVDGGLNGVHYWKLTFDYSYGVAQQHMGTFAFNCTSEAMASGAAAGLEGKAVSVHYKPSDESKGILWEDEVWDIWWDTYWQMTHPATETP